MYYIQYNPEINWKDKKVRHIYEWYVAIATLVALAMAIGARFLF